MSSCGYCGSQVPNFYKKHHQKMCLKRRLLAGEISELEYLRRKGLLKMPKPDKAPGDPLQNTLWIWQWREK